MARVTDDIYTGAEQSQQPEVISLNGQEQIALTDVDFIKNSDILRDGQDLVLQTADGQSVIIEGYFNANPAPMITAPGGETLTPQLVNSFAQTAGPTQYADNGSLSDESPVGAVHEVSGNATVTRTDGTTEPLAIGTPIYEGDIVETNANGAVEIVFIDETSFAVSQNAKLAVDEFVFDPATESGTQDFSVLRGLFVFTSGLVGRDDPDDVNIDTPMGSIGIRGTIIVGNTDTGEVTVMEGAIVVRGLDGTEITLAEQFETAQFNPSEQGVSYQGKMEPAGFENNYDALKPVAGSLFSSLDEASNDKGDSNAPQQDGLDLLQDDGAGDKPPAEGDSLQEPAATEESTLPYEPAPLPPKEPIGDTTLDNSTESSPENSTTDASTTSFDGNSGDTFNTTQNTFDNTALNTGDTNPETTNTSGSTATQAPPPSGTSGSSTSNTTSGTNTSSTTTQTQTQPPSTLIGSPPVGTDANAGNMLASNGYVRLFANDSVTNLNIGGQFTDPDGDALTYSIVQTQQNGTNTALPFITLSGSVLSMDVPDGFTAINTQLQVTVQATDTNGNTGAAIITIDLLGTDVAGTTGGDAGLASGAPGDVVNGLDGNDTLTLGHNNTVGFGGTGNDTINISAGTGHVIYGGAGSDTVDYSSYAGLTSLSVNLSLASTVTATYTGGTDALWHIENVTGSVGDDTIIGTIGANTLDGSTGDDNLQGLAGDDTIIGGAGDDVINGGVGNDTLQGGTGDDRFIVTNTDGTDTIDGGTGGETSGDWYDAGTVTSNINVDVAGSSVTYGGVADTVTNVERFTTGSGADTFTVTDAATGNKVYDGNAGTDTYDASARSGAITVDLTTNTVTRGVQTDTVDNIEQFIGGTGADIFVGDAGNNYFSGGGGADVFTGGAGADTIIGGAGVDTADYSTSAGAVNIDLTTSTISGGDAAGDSLTGIENLTGSSNGDNLRGDGGNNTLDGGAGNDTLRGSGGNDVLEGGAGIDTADFSLLGAANNITLTLNGATNALATSAKGTDTLRNIENVIGTAGDDTITGDANANTISGGAGDDTLTEAGGNDTLYGEGGNDTLVMSNDSSTVDGGSSSTGDTLRLAGGAGSFTLDNNNVADIENIDAATDAAQQDISLTIDSNIVNNDTGDISITLDGSDTLNLTFGAGGYTVTSGDLTGGSIVYSNGTNDITVNYSGTATGRLTTDLPPPVDLNLNVISATDGIRITDDINEKFGHDMALLGDVDRDGYSDLAFTKDVNPNDDGRVFFMNGGTSLTNINVPGLSSQTGLLNNSNTDITGGMILAAGGDFNGDGYMDYIVAAESANSTTMYSGNAQIISGQNSSVLAELTGVGGLDAAGSDIAFIGDTDGDGLDDVAVGIKNYGGSDEGAALIINGSRTALGAVDAGSPFGFSEYQNVTGGTSPIDMVVSHNGYAYVLDGTNALRIYNVNNSGAMASAGTPTNVWLGGTTKSLAIHDSGDFLYALVDGNLTVIDVTNPTTPAFTNAGSVGTPASADVAVYGHVLVVVYPDADAGGAGTDGGLRVFDIKDPTNPLPQSAVTSLTGTPNISEVVLTEQYAVVISDSGVTYIDVYTSPTTPSVLGNYGMGNIPTAIATTRDGNVTYVVDTAGTLTILDSSDPSSPSVIDTLSGYNTVTDITVHGNLVFLADTATDALYVVDAFASGGAKQIDSFSGVTDPTGLVYHDGTLFVLGSGDNTLRSFDADADGSIIQSTTANAYMGTDITNAGDYNNDGFDDFLISSPGTGEVYIAYGDKSGIIDFSNISDITGIAVDAGNEIPVMSMGDIDGDGINDIAVAATGANSGAGALHIFLGNANAAPGSSRGVGSSEVTINAAAGFEIIGGGAAGDFNGDGYADSVIAMRDTNGAGDMVHIYVLYGGPSMNGTYDNTAGSLGDSANAFHMTYQIQSHITPANFDINIETAGDVNGDGFGDIMIGVPQADTDADSDEDGEVIVVYGRETAVANVITDNDGTDADAAANSIAATTTGDALVGSNAADTLSDAGWASVNMSGGAGDDILQINNLNPGTLNGGGGYDTLEFQFTGGTLDFTALGDESFKNIEAINMAGSNQTVVLGLDDVFDMMETSTNNVGGKYIAQLDSTGGSNNIYVIEANTWNVQPGILADNDFTTADPGEGGMAAFGPSTVNGGFETFDFGSGYELWINSALLGNGNVVVAHNIVTDGDSDDASGTAGTIQASLGAQSLIGSTAADIFNDGNQFDTAMFGFGGDDIFELNGGNFDMISGGAGNDTIVLYADLDLMSFDAHDISQIETIEMGQFGSNTLTVSSKNLLNLLASSDTNTLTINSTDFSDVLRIDNMQGSNVSTASAADVAAALGATNNGASGGYYSFTVGGDTLLIDQTLIDNNNTSIL